MRSRLHVQRARRARGFTLVEVLVAMLVMAIMAVMAWQGVDGIMRAREASTSRLDRTLRLQTVLTQWEQDLVALQDSRVVPALMFDGATLRVTRRGPAGMQVVAWSLRGGAWWRWAGPVTTLANELQQQWLASQQLLGNEPGQLKVLDGIPRWQVYFFRGSGWTNAQSSADVEQVQSPEAPAASASAPRRAATRAALPTGVRVVLSLYATDSEPTLTRDVALAPQQP
jgi:general secretion pathway protein J